VAFGSLCEEPLGTSGGASGSLSVSFSEPLGIMWSFWEPLGTSGSLREPLGASGSLWEPSGAFGEPLESLWEPLSEPLSEPAASGERRRSGVRRRRVPASGGERRRTAGGSGATVHPAIPQSTFPA
jgi:hypothetical protein